MSNREVHFSVVLLCLLSCVFHGENVRILCVYCLIVNVCVRPIATLAGLRDVRPVD